MQQAVSARAPAHLWIVGILSLLWNAFGCYDYLMTNHQQRRPIWRRFRPTSSRIRTACPSG